VTGSRIPGAFAQAKAEGRTAIIPFLTAGFPTLAESEEIFLAMVRGGVDAIEVGVPFSDPLADGATIQRSSEVAIANGVSLDDCIALVRRLRETHGVTIPLILMGYYNPIWLIVVDLPPEEDRELCIPAREAGLNFIRLATPTTDDRRLPKVLENTSGFVYYVSLTGITGAALADYTGVSAAVKRIKGHTGLPIAVGFGVKNADNAAQIARNADGVVVGSALVDALKGSLGPNNAAGDNSVEAVTALVASIAAGVRDARKKTAGGKNGGAFSWLTRLWA